MAKVASGLAKPHGVLLVRAGTEAATLAPLPVRKLPGHRAGRRGSGCARAGIATLGAARRRARGAAAADLRRVHGGRSARRARGEGTDELGRERPAFREHDPQGVVAGTISNERTFVETSRATTAGEVLSGLCERVGSRARAARRASPGS